METCNREFNEIYKKYKNLVLKVAYTNSGNNYDAADDILLASGDFHHSESD